MSENISSIKLVVIGNCDDQALSSELAYAYEKMLGLLPPMATVVEVSACTFKDWLDQAQQHISSIQPCDRVLFIRNRFMLWEKPMLSRLDLALKGHIAACAYDSCMPFTDFPPNYLTLRGIERYTKALQKFPNRTGRLPDSPGLFLCSRNGLSALADKQDVCFIPSVYAHDFAGYHQGRREEVLPFVPSSARSVLDVGGGEGGFLEAIKATRACETHLAEYSVTACAKARHKVDHVWQGDFLTTEFGRRFDCISFLDVLEHTENPLLWLKKAASILTPSGNIIASIPNVGHWSVIADLLEGRWDYVPAGIHCITHLRFFTRHGVLQLLDDAGLAVDRIETTAIAPPDWFKISGAISEKLNIAEGDFSTYAFLVSAKIR